MKAAILTMFTGLSPTYSLVNVAADQIRMLLDAGIEVRMLVSETCPDRERTGIFLDPRVNGCGLSTPGRAVPSPGMTTRAASGGCMTASLRRQTSSPGTWCAVWTGWTSA